MLSIDNVTIILDLVMNILILFKAYEAVTEECMDITRKHEQWMYMQT
jgi:hypothetical protein